jgi:CPA1 family monovalent cation:H+ antiporter
VIRWLGLARDVSEERRREHEEELKARFAAIEAAEQRLAAIAAERNLPADVTALLNARHEQRRRQFPRTMTDGIETAHLNSALRLELIAVEREFLHRLLREGRITDESRRRIERELDLEEQAIACKAEGFEPPL